MRRMLVAALALVGTLAAAPARALDTACTIEQVDVAGTMPFPAVGGVGLALPVQIDEASGRIVVDRSPWEAAYGTSGVEFSVGFGGVHGFLALDPGSVQGTIDGAGQIVLPAFGCSFGTDYIDAFQPLNPTVSTGLQVVALGGESHAFEGAALDFGTGELTMVGVDVLNLVITTLTGPRIRCRLDAVPDASALPRPPSVRAVSGRTRGTRLLLGMQVAAGGLPFPLDGSADVVLRLRAGDASTDLLLVRVRAAALAARGRTHQAKDDDGSAVEVLAGRAAPAAGRLTLKSGKKAATLKLDLAGVDLAGASGDVEVTVVAGARSVRRDLTAHAGKHGVRLR